MGCHLTQTSSDGSLIYKGSRRSLLSSPLLCLSSRLWSSMPWRSVGGEENSSPVKPSEPREDKNELQALGVLLVKLPALQKLAPNTHRTSTRLFTHL